MKFFIEEERVVKELSFDLFKFGEVNTDIEISIYLDNFKLRTYTYTKAQINANGLNYTKKIVIKMIRFNLKGESYRVEFKYKEEKFPYRMWVDKETVRLN